MKTTKLLLISAIALTGLINGGSISQAEEEVGSITTTGLVSFEASNEINPPVDPSDPSNPVTPIDPTEPGGIPPEGTAGPLSIDFASSLVFGTNKISGKNEIYYANAQELTGGAFRGNYAQVTDKRGTNEGWKLTVQQNGQFRNMATLNSELNGARLTFSQPNLTSNTNDVTPPTAAGFSLEPTGESAVVMDAAKDAGAGTWITMYGTAEDIDGVQKNKAISLEVPGDTAKDAVSYGTKLEWALVTSPANEE